MNDRSSPHLPDPEVAIGDDGTPRSGVSGDVYFSTSGGAAETRHVFLEGIGARELFKQRRNLRIAELGFGTGLNFLVTWQGWAATASKKSTLHYTAIEGYPMTSETLFRALSLTPELSNETTALISQWPPRVRGVSRLVFDDGRVHLTLIFNDVMRALADLGGSFDAWYLDGFSPAKNPDMWTSDVLKRVRELSAPGARIATFTAAGHVRRTLATLGFDVEKRPGFGRKRDCVAARLEAPKKDRFKPKSIAIIGAGIAGVALANALKTRGHVPTLIDAAKHPGSAASGNPVALIAPRLTRERVPMGRILASAYLRAIRFYDNLQDTGGDPWIGARGTFVMARNDDEAERQERSRQAYGWPDDVMQQVSPARASVLTSVDVPGGGLWFAGAGAISPAHVIAQLSAGINYARATVQRLSPSDAGWRIGTAEGKLRKKFDVVCIAAGVGIIELVGAETFPLRANRGQLTYVSSLDPAPNAPITYGGYVSPKVAFDRKQSGHVLGASYARRDEIADDEWEKLRDADTRDIVANFEAHLPDIKIGDVIGGRTARRATIRDYIPLAGEFHDDLFVLGGLGSRGFMTAPLLADLVADQISGTPLPLEADLIKALSPKRFNSR